MAPTSSKGSADGQVALAISVKIADGQCTAKLVGCLCQIGDARHALVPLLIACCRQTCP